MFLQVVGFAQDEFYEIDLSLNNQILFVMFTSQVQCLVSVDLCSVVFLLLTYQPCIVFGQAFSFQSALNYQSILALHNQ